MIIEGVLASQAGIPYPIVYGIPHFIEQKKYTASFGHKWKRWLRVQLESISVSLLRLCVRGLQIIQMS